MQRLRLHARLILDVFVTANLGFLALDIVLAHSVNRFGHMAEWVPLGFSVLAAGVLGALLLGGARRGTGTLAMVSEVVGWGAVLVGVAGLLFHLESAFFERATLQSLVYSAPFVAPLAYAGLGLLLLLNRRMDPRDGAPWGQWVLFLALCGVVGNLGLSLADHSQNGFFQTTEWIPVAVAAFGVGALLPAVVWPDSTVNRRVAWAGVALQAVTGVLGFVLHAVPAIRDLGSTAFYDTLIYGPPPFAPLLFADLALLAALGLTSLPDTGVAVPVSDGTEQRFVKQPGGGGPRAQES